MLVSIWCLWRILWLPIRSLLRILWLLRLPIRGLWRILWLLCPLWGLPIRWLLRILWLLPIRRILWLLWLAIGLLCSLGGLGVKLLPVGLCCHDRRLIAAGWLCCVPRGSF